MWLRSFWQCYPTQAELPVGHIPLENSVQLFLPAATMLVGNKELFAVLLPFMWHQTSFHHAGINAQPTFVKRDCCLCCVSCNNGAKALSSGDSPRGALRAVFKVSNANLGVFEKFSFRRGVFSWDHNRCKHSSIYLLFSSSKVLSHSSEAEISFARWFWHYQSSVKRNSSGTPTTKLRCSRNTSNWRWERLYFPQILVAASVSIPNEAAFHALNIVCRSPSGCGNNFSNSLDTKAEFLPKIVNMVIASGKTIFSFASQSKQPFSVYRLPFPSVLRTQNLMRKQESLHQWICVVHFVALLERILIYVRMRQTAHTLFELWHSKGSLNCGMSEN